MKLHYLKTLLIASIAALSTGVLFGDTYTLSKTGTTSYSHRARGGSSPSLNSYRVEVPSGMIAVVKCVENSATLSKTASTGSYKWVLDGANCPNAPFEKTITSAGTFSIQITAKPDVSWTELYIDSYLSNGMPHYSSRYHYYDDYYMEVSYTISVRYSPPPKTYTVTYKPGTKGAGTEQKVTKTEGTALTLKGEIYTRSGYKQTGWSKSDGGTKLYDLNASYTQDAAITLFPCWTAVYTVTYSPGANGTGSAQTATKMKGASLTLKGEIFTRSGYKQTGWSKSDGGTKKYDLNASYAADASVELFPYWTQVYTVTYKPGSYGTGSDQAATKEEGGSLELEGTGLFERTGYYQDGWSKNPNGSTLDYGLGATYSADASMTLYPHWQVTLKSISIQGASSVDSGGVATYTCVATYYDGETKTVTPEWSLKNGSACATISSTGKLTAKTVSSLSSVTICASYDEVYSDFATSEEATMSVFVNPPVIETYSITYNPGAYSSDYAQFATKTNGVALTLKGALFTRIGYTQTGWALGDGRDKAYELNGVYSTDSAVALYPYWTPNSYTITYDLNGGNPDSTHPERATYDTAFQVSAPTRLAAVFAGWTVTAGLDTAQAKWGTTSNPSTAITSSTTKCVNGETGSVWFMNLTPVANENVMLTANWTEGGGASEGRSQTISLQGAGWTWVSVNVEPEDPSVASVFRGVSFADNDVVKSSDGSATYYDGKWYPSPATFKLVAGRAYAVKKSTAGDATVTVSGTSATSSLVVTAGWNWIGPMTGNSVSRDALKHSGGFTDNDVISSSSSSATYYGGTWYGSLLSLEPGVGYKAKFGKAGTLSGK